MPRLTEPEARALTLGPDSVSWRYSSDLRLFLGSLGALLLQVAHPTVGSGVRDHSNFQAEPWARLFRTVDWVNLTIYGGEDAIETGERLGLRWTRWQERKFRLVAAASRALTPMWPEALLINGPVYLRARRRVIGYDAFAPESYRRLVS